MKLMKAIPVTIFAVLAMAVMAVEMAGHVGWGMTAKSLLETAKATKAATSSYAATQSRWLLAPPATLANTFGKSWGNRRAD